VKTAHDGEEALSYFQSNANVSAVLLDITMPRKDGMQTLREIRSMDKELPVIMVSGASAPMNVVEAMRSGATGFLGKPINQDELRQVITRALEETSEVQEQHEPEADHAEDTEFFSRNRAMQDLQKLVSRIGWSEAPVLIQGETGVGKEVLARQLHAHSTRAHRPLLKLNCAALPSELLESELFGYEKGAFTGAFQRKLGLFEQADKSTILLDEIGDMDHKLQAKLLHVLQDREFQRLGGRSTIQVDVRVIAATHQDLELAISKGTFREDLYYRLNCIQLRIPALRERKEDLLALADVLLKRHAVSGQTIPALPGYLQEAMLAYEWPGNIRELENMMRKYLVLANPEQFAAELRAKSTRRILVAQAPASAPASPRPVPVAAEPEAATPILEQVSQSKQQAETEAILAALNTTRWNRKRAAGLLKIDYKALLYKMKKLGIDDKAAAWAAKSSDDGDQAQAHGMAAGF
jgi:two-component system response regulator AtoC